MGRATLYYVMYEIDMNILMAITMINELNLNQNLFAATVAALQLYQLTRSTNRRLLCGAVRRELLYAAMLWWLVRTLCSS